MAQKNPRVNEKRSSKNDVARTRMALLLTVYGGFGRRGHARGEKSGTIVLRDEGFRSGIKNAKYLTFFVKRDKMIVRFCLRIHQRSYPKTKMFLNWAVCGAENLSQPEADTYEEYLECFAKEVAPDALGFDHYKVILSEKFHAEKGRG